MRHLRPDLHAVLKIRAGEIGGRIADLDRIVARVAQRQDGLGLHRFGHRAGACALAGENVAGHFFARAVQQTEDRVEKRRRGGGRFDFNRDVGRLIQMEARAMGFAGLRKRAFERAGYFENGGFRPGAVGFDRRLLARPCRRVSRVGSAAPHPAAASKPRSSQPSLRSAGTILRQRARAIFNS